MKVYRRWSDNDKHLGPFTYAKESYGWALGIVLDSGHGDYPGCNLRIRAFGHVLIVELPDIIKPWRRWVNFQFQSATVDGPTGYWDEHAREYGFNLNSDGFFQLFLGPQTHDSITTKDWTCFLPFTQWRHVRYSLYGIGGEHFWTQHDNSPKLGMTNIREQMKAEEECPSVAFEFDDYDGERIEVRTFITEREWHFGTGWFKWLSLFRRPKISRCLSLQFSKETGKEKGSWKGGTVGHAIEMLSNEMHKSAFQRYCTQHEMKFIK